MDKSGDHKWSNLDMCVRFSGQPDEVGFIMLHVDINQHSPSLVGSVINVLHALKDKNSTNSIKFLKENFQTMKLMNSRRREMWKASRWNHYNDFRVFIMGVKGNEELFGDGVLYEGVWDEPKQFRGQTGAQDDIIPMEDIFSGVIKHYPKNELTKYLIDLRSYRPKCIQNFFKDLEDTVNELSEEGISYILSKQNNYEGLCYLLGVLEEIYHFRNGHWQFVQKYIMANTKYAKATGGTPIISWLPNQMKAVLKEMNNVIDLIEIKDLNSEVCDLFNGIKNEIDKKVELLDHQLELINKKSFSADKVFELNKKYNLSDKKD
ncbi:indoleamine 2,3-dioxygenase [Flavobacteriaceae bacterium]|nr:indoleamine 2,3-dioxygenase [Flavobacteriaceae bacterium]